MAVVHQLNAYKSPSNSKSVVVFEKKELNIILSVYGRMVSCGQWKDYSISMLEDVSIFSCYKHASEYPIYKIEKRPKLRSKQGMYSVISIEGRILKRGHDLFSVLSIFESKLLKVNNKKNNILISF